MFAAPIGERVADKVVPPVRQPGSLADYNDAGQLQLARDQSTNTIGTWLAVGLGVGVFFLVRDWRAKRGGK
jgi:hypothetical protein